MTNTLDVMEGFLAVVAIICINYPIFFLNVPRAINFRASVYAGVLLVMCIISYFYVLEKRKSFFWNNTLEKKNVWYKSILENMKGNVLVMIAHSFLNLT